MSQYFILVVILTILSDFTSDNSYVLGMRGFLRIKIRASVDVHDISVKIWKIDQKVWDIL